MASRALGVLVKWKRLNGAVRVPPMFFPGTSGFTSIISSSERYGHGCFSSTRVSSSLSQGRLTPEERQSLNQRIDPKKLRKLSGQEIREYLDCLMAGQRESRRNHIVTNQLLETIAKNTTPVPSGMMDTLLATWGYKLPPKNMRIARILAMLLLSYLLFEFVSGRFLMDPPAADFCQCKQK